MLVNLSEIRRQIVGVCLHGRFLKLELAANNADTASSNSKLMKALGYLVDHTFDSKLLKLKLAVCILIVQVTELFLFLQLQVGHSSIKVVHLFFAASQKLCHTSIA